MASDEYKEMQRAALAQCQAMQSANGRIDSRTLVSVSGWNMNDAYWRAANTVAQYQVSASTEGCAAQRSAAGSGLIASTKDDYLTEPGVAMDDDETTAASIDTLARMASRRTLSRRSTTSRTIV